MGGACVGAASSDGGAGQRRRWLGLGHGGCGERNSTRGYMGPPTRQNRKQKKSPEAARDQLTGRSGGSDRTLSPSVRSIPERSNSSRIMTGRVRWSMTGRRQGPVGTTCFSFKRPDAGSLPDRTHKRSVRSLLQQQFTSCELTGRWTAASDAVSSAPFSANLQSSFALPVPNQVPT